MGTSFEAEADLRKTSQSLTDPGRALQVRTANAGKWMASFASSRIAALKSSTWWTFLVVVLAIGCVAYADSRVEDVSLGYLYILPLSFSAILLSPRLTYAIVVVCIFFHDLFGPPIHHIQGRILHNLTALLGFAFVVAVLQWFVAQRNALNELTRNQRDALQKEVELAAEVQRLFLPSSDPDTEGFEIAGAMHPARGGRRLLRLPSAPGWENAAGDCGCFRERGHGGAVDVRDGGCRATGNERAAKVVRHRQPFK